MHFTAASGDGDRNDRRLGTFNALFPKGKSFGELSPIGPYNMIDISPKVALDLGRGWGLAIAGMASWRERREDGVYGVPGNLIRSGRAGASRFIGNELETTAEWQATPELQLSASLSAFRPGAFLRESGGSRTITMIGFESRWRI
jgi:hypothetical protein